MGKSFYWSQYHWEFPNERARLVEIVQGRGNFEADALDDYWGIQNAGMGASVQDAFARGWRLGFVAGTDNHQGHPTQNPGGYVGMTCFRAAELTREAVWQAMDERWTYATSGVPIVCDYSVNGVRSGAEGVLAAGEKEVHFSASLHGTAPIERVEIVAAGRCVWRGAPDSWDVEIDGAELPAPGRNGVLLLLPAAAAEGRAPGLAEPGVAGPGGRGAVNNRKRRDFPEG